MTVILRVSGTMVREKLLLLLATAFTLVVSSYSQDNAISFYDGHHQEIIPANEQDSVNVQLQFRTLHSSGVLLLAHLQPTLDCIAILLQGNQLQVVMSQGQEWSTVGSVTFANDSDLFDWQAVELSLTSEVLQVWLQQQPFLQHTFTTPVTVSSLYLGGPPSFFEEQYQAFPLPHYYIGCLSNISVNSRPVQVDSSREGVSEGCCVAPGYPIWCLDSTHTNITVNSTSEHSSSDTLRLSFRLRAHSAGGLVVLGHSLSSAWALQLNQSHLLVRVNVSGHVEDAECPGTISLSGGWHQISILLAPSHIACDVDGITETTATQLSAFSFPSTLQLGGASHLIAPLSELSFFGCYQRVRLNDTDIGVSLSSDGESAVSASLTWSDFALNSSELLVGRGTHQILTTTNIYVELPLNRFADHLKSHYQLELESALHFEASSGPNHGHLFSGPVTAQVEDFSYASVLSGDVGYVHDGQENLTDSITFDVWVGCGDTVVAELGELVLHISVEDQDEGPSVWQSEGLHLAVGTRRLLTPQMVTVTDDPPPNPAQVLFLVQSVRLQDDPCDLCTGTSCEGCEEGGVIIKNGNPIQFFTQEDINEGLISFQHFAKFSTSPMQVHLEVTVPTQAGSANIDVTIPVTLYQGSISLTSSLASCLFVKESDMVLLKPSHLNAETTFEDQDPVLVYDLLTLPVYGILQRYEPKVSEWVDITNSTSSYASLQGGVSFSSFTQADVDQDRVRYVQSEPYSWDNSEFETFKFGLRSYNFSGPTVQLCVDIVLDELAPQPTIDVVMTSLLVPENGSAVVNRTFLDTSLSFDDRQYSVHEPDFTVDLQQLEVVFTLVDPPTYGDLELRGKILVADDVFTYSDVTSGALLYQHDGSENHMDSFTFYGESGSTAYLPIKAPNLTSNLTLVINITAKNNHLPKLIVEESIRPPEGGWVLVTPKHINVTDLDRPPNVLTIFLKRKNIVPNGIFAFQDDPSVPIGRFTMENILNGDIIFMHTNLSLPLNYSQRLRIDDELNTIREPIFIAVIPLILTVSLPPDLDCIVTIDTEQSLQAQLNASLFTITLQNHHGNYPNLAPEVAVNVLSPPTHGLLELVAENQIGNHQVTHIPFHHLNRVRYRLPEASWNVTADEFTLQFQYGHSVPVILPLTVCIQPRLVPLSLSVSDLEVKMGGVANLSTQHLAVVSSREQDKGALVFKVVTKPQHGILLNLASDELTNSLANFSHAELTSGVIVYEHEKVSSLTQDSAVIQVCSLLHCLQEQTLTILVSPINLSVGNTSIRMHEGGVYRFSLSDFNVSAPPNRHVIFAPRSGPKHGELFLVYQLDHPIFSVTHFNLNDIEGGSLYYNNTERERVCDSLEIEVQVDEQLDFIMKIYFDPVNNHPPEIVILNQDLNVTRGGFILLSSSILNAHDYDVDMNDNDLVWTIGEVSAVGGVLYLEDDPSTSIRNWTERDIRNNKLYYRHTKLNANLDFLVLTVSDGEFADTKHLFIHIVEVAFGECSDLSEFVVSEGGSGNITRQHLCYTAKNVEILSNTDIHYNISRLPYNGTLVLNGQPVRVGEPFTQEQVDMGQLVYIHDDSNTKADSFDFELFVSAQPQHSVPMTFELAVTSIDDDAPMAILAEALFVLEKQHVLINSEIIDIVDIDSTLTTQKDKIVCQLIQPLTSGRIEKQRFGQVINQTQEFTKYDIEEDSVWYRHLASSPADLFQDTLVFNLTDGTNKQHDNYTLPITVLPHIVGLSISRLAVTENEMVKLTRDELMPTHPYLQRVPGIITVKNNSGPYHGELIMKTSENTTRDIAIFSTEDIASGHVFYSHNGDESRNDSFQFHYVALDPAGYNRSSDFETMHVVIAPVNDQRPLVENNVTTLRLWATDTVFLNQSHLNASDGDTDASKLNFTFSILSLGGYIVLSNDTATPIFWFTQADVDAHRVKFKHLDGPSGSIVYTVTDGVHSASGLISVLADPLTLECDVSQWTDSQVSFLGSVTITDHNIFCTFSDNDGGRNVSFSVSDTQLGHIEVNSEPRNEFTSTEISAGAVKYVHTERDVWQQQETLEISATSPPAYPAGDLRTRVIIHYPQPPVGSHLAVNTGLNISEGGSHIINESVLDGRNLRYSAYLTDQDNLDLVDLSVVYEVVGMPRHGNLTVNQQLASVFLQTDLAEMAVQYSHDDSETQEDVVLLNVSVQHGGLVLMGPYEEWLQITVCPENDEPPILLTSSLEKTLVRPFDTVLSATDLEVRDKDTPAHQLFFTLHSVPNNTKLLLNSSQLTTDSFFTQEAVDKGWITFRPLSEGVSHFSFSFTDGAQSSPQALQYTLRVEDHYLKFLRCEDITYLQNETGAVITTDLLNTTTNGQRSQTIFRVRPPPSYGRVMMEGVEVEQFTQVDVDQQLVHYVPHKGSQQHRDSFTLNVSNADHHFIKLMSVRILAWAHTTSGLVNFNEDSDSLVRPLPADVLVLTALQSEASHPPTITLLEEPTFGHLEMRIPDSSVGLSKRSVKKIERFRYDELVQGWIVYVWGRGVLMNESITESFSVLVSVEGVQPGETVITFTVHPPHHLTAPPPTLHTTPTSPSAANEQATESLEDGSSFPVYTLVPIIGIILFLALLVLVVLLFCRVQQKRLKKKWVPTISQQRHPSPTPWLAQTPQMPLQVTHYDFDPSAMPLGTENDHHNSDTSSGFSEPECSPRHTPISAYSSHPLGPPYHPQPPRSRVRSNVSITFSSRQSTTSEMSVDDDPIAHSSVSQYPPYRASAATPIPLPVRPASHAAFNRPSAVPPESGIFSLNSPSGEQGEQDSQVEQSMPTVDHKPLHSKLQEDYSTQEEPAAWPADGTLPDFNDPKIQRLFSAHHDPILKKEEYWV